MIVKGVVVRLLEPVKGTSQKGEWNKQEVIVQQPGEFGRQVCISFWSDKADEAANLKEGEAVSIDINISSREYNERWYTDIQGWKINRDGAQAQPQTPPMPTSSDFSSTSQSEHSSAGSSEDSFDDLPF